MKNVLRAVLRVFVYGVRGIVRAIGWILEIVLALMGIVILRPGQRWKEPRF